MTVIVECFLAGSLFPFDAVLEDAPGVTLELESVVPRGDGTLHVWIEGENSRGVLEAIRGQPHVESVEVLDEVPDGLLAKVESTEPVPGVIEIANRVNARVMAATGTVEGWEFTVWFGDEASLESFYSAASDRDIDLQLKHLEAGGTEPNSRDVTITEKQRETLRYAFDAGYFDIPRQATLTDIAAEHGITEQGVSERIRRGLAGLLDTELPQRDPAGARGLNGDE